MVTLPLRIGTASLVSPAIVAAATACWFAFERQDWSELSPSFAGLALIAYPIMALFMLPIFLILWRKGRVSFLASSLFEVGSNLQRALPLSVSLFG